MRSLEIIHLYPDLLNLYGDGGNVGCLQKRCEWRGIPVQVREVLYGKNEQVDLAQADIIFLGGGSDQTQQVAFHELQKMQAQVQTYVEAGGVLLAVGGGYQMLGTTCLLGEKPVQGLGVLDVETQQSERFVGDVVLRSKICDQPVVGHENHVGQTFLGTGLEPFGVVVFSGKSGNNDENGTDGVLYKNTIGTYVQGSFLAKNPQVADWLLQRALDQRATSEGAVGEPVVLQPLDDDIEEAANQFMLKRLGL